MLFKRLTIKDYNNCFCMRLSYKTSKKPKVIKNDKKESKRCSLSRSCTMIKDYVLSNEFEYFFTLTLKGDIKFDILSAYNFVNNSIKNYSKKANRLNKDFKYVYVFELTKKGGLHLHGFFSGFFDLYINQYGYLSSLFFDNLGFQNFIEASKCNPFYLIKYVIKSNIELLPRVYHASKNLNLPHVETFEDNFEEFLKFPFTYENNYCKMITIAKS